jgi:hypothetical protein
MKYGIALFALTSAMLANAQDAQQWGKDTKRSLASCAMVGSANRIMGTVAADDFRESKACTEREIEKAKPSFQALSPQKKSSAERALKDYYAAWIAAMRAVPSLLAGSNDAATSAYTSSKQRLDEMWARYEVEAGI